MVKMIGSISASVCAIVGIILWFTFAVEAYSDDDKTEKRVQLIELILIGVIAFFAIIFVACVGVSLMKFTKII